MNQTIENETRPTRAEGEERIRAAARPGRTARAAALAAFLALGGVLVACGPNDAQDAEGALETEAPAVTGGPATPDVAVEDAELAESTESAEGAALAGEDAELTNEPAPVVEGAQSAEDATVVDADVSVDEQATQADTAAGDAPAAGDAVNAQTGATAEAGATTEAGGVAGGGTATNAETGDAAAQAGVQQGEIQTLELAAQDGTLVVEATNADAGIESEQGLALAVGERYELQADGPVTLMDAEGQQLLATDASDAAFASDPEVAFESTGNGIAFTLTQDLADLIASIEADGASVPVVVRGS